MGPVTDGGDLGVRKHHPKVGGAGAAVALRQGDIADGQHRPIVIEDGALALGVRQVGARGLSPDDLRLYGGATKSYRMWHQGERGTIPRGPCPPRSGLPMVQ
jgi:hypothetical protein